MTNLTNKNHKGQVLLFVIVAVTIAISLGLSLSSRTVSSVKRVSRTDTFSRVVAAAEAGAELGMQASASIFNKLQSGTIILADCRTGFGSSASVYNVNTCKIVLHSATTSDPVDTFALVSAATFNYNPSAADSFGTQDYYWFYLEPGNVKEVRLNSTAGSNTEVELCWDAPDTTAIHYIIYDETDVLAVEGVRKSGKFGAEAPTFDIATVTNGTYLCTGAIDVTDAKGIRVRSLYEGTKVVLFPKDGEDLPTQGYKVTSTGYVEAVAGTVESKTVTVYKAYPYAAGVLDFALHSPSITK